MKFPIISIVRSTGLLGLALSAVSCVGGPPYRTEGNNVFIKDTRPRYGYQGTDSPAGDPAKTEKPDKPKNDRGEDPAKLHDHNNGPANDPPAQPDPTADKPVADPTPPAEDKPKPAANLPFGTPVIGKPGFVYSPYAPDKGMVDVEDIPSGTKVACPYTNKVFRVP